MTDMLNLIHQNKINRDNATKIKEDDLQRLSTLIKDEEEKAVP